MNRVFSWKRIACILTAAVLLPLFSLFLVHSSATERMMGYVSSALSFLTAAAAGARAARTQKTAPLLCGILCAAFLTLLLLLCGLLLDRKSISSDSVLSLASMSFAGALFGSVVFGGRMRKTGRRHARFHPHGDKRKS